MTPDDDRITLWDMLGIVAFGLPMMFSAFRRWWRGVGAEVNPPRPRNHVTRHRRGNL